jgi:hypothetical protein
VVLWSTEWLEVKCMSLQRLLYTYTRARGRRNNGRCGLLADYAVLRFCGAGICLTAQQEPCHDIADAAERP